MSTLGHTGVDAGCVIVVDPHRLLNPAAEDVVDWDGVCATLFDAAGATRHAGTSVHPLFGGALTLTVYGDGSYPVTQTSSGAQRSVTLTLSEPADHRDLRERQVTSVIASQGLLLVGDPCYVIDDGPTFERSQLRVDDEVGDVNGCLLVAVPAGRPLGIHARVDDRGRAHTLRVECGDA